MRHSGMIAGFIAVASAAVGCDEPKETTVYQYDSTIDCESTESTPLEATENTPVGSPEETVDWILGEQNLAMQWWRYEPDRIIQMDTTVTFFLSGDVESAQFVTSSSNDPECADRMVIEGKIGFQSWDGIFNETFDIDIIRKIDNNGQTTIEGTSQLDGLRGSYDVSVLSQKYKNPVLKISAVATPRLTNGELVVTESKSSGDKEASQIATFGAN